MENEPTLPLSYTRHIADTIKLSIPVMIGQLGNVLMMVIDNMMVGALGYQELSAASLANNIFFFIVVFGMGLGFAITPLVAEAKSAGRILLCGRYFSHGLFLGVITGILLGILVLGSILLLPYMDQPPEDVILAKSYMVYLAISAIPMTLFLVGKHFADGLSYTRPAMYITLVGLLINVGGNWLFIYGNWGLPRMELDGAGLATVMSRGIMMGLVFWHVLTHATYQPYLSALQWNKFQGPILKKITSLAVPSGLQFFFEVSAFVGASLMIGWIGAVERAAHQIAISLASITYMVTTGIAAGTTIRVGTAFGKRDLGSVKRAGLSGLLLATIFMLAAAATFVVGRDFLPSFYIKDTDVLQIASVLMLISAFFQLFDGVQAVAIGALRGIQDVRIPTWITFAAYWVFALPGGYFMGFILKLGVNGVWYSLTAGLMFSAIFLTSRFLLLARKSQPFLAYS